MLQLNLASCNGPGGKVVQLKYGICEDLIQNLYHFSALKVGNRGLFFPNWVSVEAPALFCVQHCLSVTDPCALHWEKTWEPNSYSAANGTSKVTGKFQMQNLLLSCSSLWKTENQRHFRGTEGFFDYFLWMIFYMLPTLGGDYTVNIPFAFSLICEHICHYAYASSTINFYFWGKCIYFSS